MSDIFDMFKEPAAEQSSSYSSSGYSSSNVFVLSIGGSVICARQPNPTAIAKIAGLVSELSKEGYKFAVVVGGGKTARDYIAAAKSLGANNYATDEIAIAVTRTNAKLFIQALEDSHPEVLADVNKAKEIISSGKIPVFGGLIPGFTTDTVAAVIAESLGAKFVNLTNTDGIYTADPKKSKSAKRIPKLNHERLLRIISGTDQRLPGSNVVLDLFTVMILKRSNIKAFVLDSGSLENIKSAIRGGEFEGTVIESEGAEETNQEENLDEI